MTFPHARTRYYITQLLILLIFMSASTNFLTAQSRGLFDGGKRTGKEISTFGAVTPIIFPENTDCADLNAAPNPELAHIVRDFGYRIDDDITGTYPYVNDANFPQRVLTGGGVDDPGNSVSLTFSGMSFDWTSTKAVTAVIVRGFQGPGVANVYPYAPRAFGDQGLTTSGGANFINSVEFCYQTPATVTIIKEVQTFGGGTASTTAFPFTATNLGTPNFSLIDNNVVGPDRLFTTGIYDFGPANSIGVTESVVTNWTLGDITCVEVAGGGVPNSENTTVNLGTRSANIILEEGESVTCTFSNLQLVPTAANAFIEGRVLAPAGRGISRARLNVLNVNTGETRTVFSNVFGYFKVDALPVGFFYVVTVDHKRYKFDNPSQSFSLDDNMSGIDFISR
jgi:hypothetical protein